MAARSPLTRRSRRRFEITDLVDRHELRLALEREEATAKRLLGKNAPLATAFFEIVYRTLNGMPFPHKTQGESE